jgi:ABC-2 type transport system permease protein
MVPLAWAGLLVPFRLFHTPFHGAWPVIMGATAVFVVINTLSGFGVAGICRTPVLSTQILLVLSVPVFTLSGATWPIFAMPEWLQYVSRLIPLTHFANIVRKVSLIGVPVRLFRQDVIALAVWLAVSAVWAYWAIRRMTNDAHT